MLAGDGRILEGFDFEDLDEASVSQYRNRFSATKPQHPWLALDDRTLLERLGGWRRDRDTGRQGLTLAGLLMLGKHEAIIAPDAAPGYFVDFRAFCETHGRGSMWSDRLFPDGTWEANLLQFFERSWAKLTSNLSVPRSNGTAMTPAHVALREAVVNALVHTDYDAPGGIVFERYPDRFALENPGTLMISQEQLRRGGVSQCRNKSLQRMFMLIGGCDQAGMGFRRIREGWQSQLWTEPSLSTQEHPDRVRLDFVMRNDLPEQLFAISRPRSSSRR